jgi:3'(2'), 5'-bisphosphate nucleotidase
MQDYQGLLSLAIDAALKAGNETLKYYLQKFDVLVKEDHSPLTLADLEANRVINEILEPTGIPILSEENKLIPFETRKNWKQFWLVDPLDGTKEFINQSTEYTVNIALIEDGIPVLGVVFAPALNTLYYGLIELGSFKAIKKDTNKAEDIHAKAKALRLSKPQKDLRIVASRSHLSDETKAFIHKIERKSKIGEMHSYGSSLKICMIAEGSADIYPRLGPTMEWDTAASHAVAIYAGCEILNLDNTGQMLYNKENLLNPRFVVYNKALDKLIESII